MQHILIALAQINPIVGNIQYNADKIIDAAHDALQCGASLIVFPELCLSGYPPEDLILKEHFLNDCQACAVELANRLPKNIVAIVGSPWREGSRAFNAALVYSDGRLVSKYFKVLLPNYSVFDEKRVFAAGTGPLIIKSNGMRFGVHICEDSWEVEGRACDMLRERRVQAILNLSASPYYRGKIAVREARIGRVAQELDCYLMYANLVGGQDELVFDGASMVLSPTGETVARAEQFKEQLLYYPLDIGSSFDFKGDEATCSIEIAESRTEVKPIVTLELDPLEEVYKALLLGLSDYVEKNGFKQVVIALSGGIDSALVAILAVDALGADRVNCITMPSQYSTSATLNDATTLADNMGVKLHTVPIKTLFDTYIAELTSYWEGQPEDITEENLQARIRGNIIMAFSNKFGWLVLTTGNKSEMATGYCTLYGDMAGGFAVIKDVPKTLVFELCRWRNEQAQEPVIPLTIITRPPSAELRPDQKDTDSLPPYEVLDQILDRYVERDMVVRQIIDDGFDPDTVVRIARLVDRSEYKRRQGPPGIKIMPKAFGRDRRVPITNQYTPHV